MRAPPRCLIAVLVLPVARPCLRPDVSPADGCCAHPFHRRRDRRGGTCGRRLRQPTFDARKHVTEAEGGNAKSLSLNHVADHRAASDIPDRDIYVFDTTTARLVEVVDTLGTLLYGIAADLHSRRPADLVGEPDQRVFHLGRRVPGAERRRRADRRRRPVRGAWVRRAMTTAPPSGARRRKSSSSGWTRGEPP